MKFMQTQKLPVVDHRLRSAWNDLYANGKERILIKVERHRAMKWNSNFTF